MLRTLVFLVLLKSTQANLSYKTLFEKRPIDKYCLMLLNLKKYLKRRRVNITVEHI